MMNHGKYRKRSSRRSKKTMALLVSLVLLVGITLGSTIAYLSVSSQKVVNEFKPGEVTTSVDEKFDGTTKTDVSIKNTGNTSAWIRAAVVVTWQDAAGNVYSKAPVAGVDYTDWTPGNDWKVGRDGFYYNTKPVAAGASTGAMIKEIVQLSDAPADGYYLNVEIIGSGIQSKPAKVFNTEWANSGFAVDDAAADPMAWTLKQGG